MRLWPRHWSDDLSDMVDKVYIRDSINSAAGIKYVRHKFSDLNGCTQY